MRIRKFTAAAAAAALAMSPIAAHASSPLLMSAQTTAQMEDDQVNGPGTEIGIIFVLIIFAVFIFASGDGGDDNQPLPPVSP